MGACAGEEPGSGIGRKPKILPTFDAHAHIDPSRSPEDLASAGIVLAMTLSLDEASTVIGRRDPNIAWAVGCHPRFPRAQQTFDLDRFLELVDRVAIVGEIGIDGSSRVPLGLQLRIFREILSALSALPRIVSIHSHRAAGHVLEELRRTPLHAPVLHWWTGTAEETREAVRLGCIFSVHPAVARHSKFRTAVPRDRLLTESDHGLADSPVAIPGRIERAERLLGRSLAVENPEVRRLVWRNFGEITQRLGVGDRLPPAIVKLCDSARAWPA